MSEALVWEQDGHDWPNASASRFVAAGGLTWHVQTMGSGPVMLLLHGTGASTHSWSGLMPLLAQRFTVMAVDLPGHGFTSSPTNGQLSLPAMARGVAALLAQLGLQPDYVTGHSAGAAIAIRMCVDKMINPRRIIGLNAALLPFGGLASQLFPAMAKLLSFNPLVPRFFAWRAADPSAVSRLIASTGSKLDAEALAFYRRLFASRRHMAAMLGMMANWDIESLQPDLKKLATPLTLVVGDADTAVPPEDARKLRRMMADVSIITLPGAGHLCHEERPREVARIIESAIAETKLAPKPVVASPHQARRDARTQR